MTEVTSTQIELITEVSVNVGRHVKDYTDSQEDKI